LSCSKALLGEPLELHNFATGFLSLASAARAKSRKRYVETGRLIDHEAAVIALQLAGPSAAIYRSAKVALLEVLVAVQNEMLAFKTREVKAAKEADLLAALDTFSALLASTVGPGYPCCPVLSCAAHTSVCATITSAHKLYCWRGERRPGVASTYVCSRCLQSIRCKVLMMRTKSGYAQQYQTVFKASGRRTGCCSFMLWPIGELQSWLREHCQLHCLAASSGLCATQRHVCRDCRGCKGCLLLQAMFKMNDGTVPPIHVDDMSCEQLLAYNSLVKEKHFSFWTEEAQQLGRELGAPERR
jgi:hypothetical protein